ncbi:MAG: hypothetical protein GY863_04855 [bacterium]|nr:hypothetical protein [bacterium]
MKILILKLGILMFAISFLVGAFREMEMFTIVMRSFVAFLAIEGVLVLMAVVIIKVTEELRTEEDEEVGIEE